LSHRIDAHEKKQKKGLRGGEESCRPRKGSELRPERRAGGGGGEKDAAEKNSRTYQGGQKNRRGKGRRVAKKDGNCRVEGEVSQVAKKRTASGAVGAPVSKGFVFC